MALGTTPTGSEKGTAPIGNIHQASLILLPVEVNFEEGDTNIAILAWKHKLNEIRSNRRVTIPCVRQNIDWDRVKLLYGRCSRASGLPDPACMSVKAAINFSYNFTRALYPSFPDPSEASSDGYINTSQGEDFYDASDRLRSAVESRKVLAGSNPRNQGVV